MVEWGWLELFAGGNATVGELAQDPEATVMWLLQPTEMLKANHKRLAEEYQDIFDPPNFPDNWGDKITLDVQLISEDTSVYDDEFPHILAADTRASAHTNNAAAHYGNRDAPRFPIPVQPVDKLHPHQPAHVVMRGASVGNDFQPHSGSVRQVSEIISICGLDDYIGTKKKLIRATTALLDIKDPSNGEDIANLLNLFHIDDLIAIVDFIRSYILPKDAMAFERSQMENTKVARVLEAINLVPTARGKRKHVIRQIVLLASAIVQDVIASSSGEIICAFPRSTEVKL